MKTRIYSLLKKMLLIALTSLLVLLLAFLAYLETSYFDEWAKGLMIRQFEDRFSGRLRIGSVDISIWGGSIEVEDLQISNRLFQEDSPSIEVELTKVNFSLMDAISGKLKFEEIVVLRPRIRFIENSNNRLNILNIFTSQEQTANPDRKPFHLASLGIQRARIDQGLFVLKNQDIQFNTDAEGLSIEIEYQKTGETYFGSTSISVESFSINKTPIPISEFEGTFHLMPDRLVFPVASCSSDALAASFEGEFMSLSELAYQFNVEVSAQIPELDQFEFLDPVHEGALESSGTFTGQGSDFEYRGFFSSPNLRVWELTATNTMGTVVIDREKLEIENISAAVLNGQLHGLGTIRWQSGTSEIKVQLSGSQIRRVVRSFGLHSLPLDGKLAAQMVMNWPSIEFSSLRGVGTINASGLIGYSDARAEHETRVIPFFTESGFELDTEQIRFLEGSVETPESGSDYEALLEFDGRFELSGELTSLNSLELTRIAENIGVLPVDALAPYRIELAGPLSAGVSLLRGPEGAWSIEGDADLSTIRYGDSDLGGLSGVFNYEDEEWEFEDLSLEGPGYLIQGDVILPRQTADTFALTADLSTSDFPLKALNDLMSQEGRTLDGLITGSSRLVWGEDGLVGTVTLTGKHLKLEDFELSGVKADLLLEHSRIATNNLQVQAYGGIVKGSGFFDLSSSEYAVDLQGEGLSISRVTQLDGISDLRGVVSLKANASGSLPSIQFQVETKAPHIAVGPQVFEQVTLEGSSDGHQVEFLLGATYEGQGLRADGTVGMEVPYPLQAKVSFSAFPIGPLVMQLLEEPLDLGGYSGGEIDITTNLDGSSPLAAQARIDQLQVVSRDYSLDLTSSLNISYSGDELKVDKFQLQGKKTDILAAGKVNFMGAGSIELRVEGETDLTILNSLLETGNTQGQIILKVDIAGDLESPKIVGNARLTNGALSHNSIPISLTDAQGEFKFTTSQVSIDSFRAQTPYGPLRFEGGVFLEGFAPTKWQINAYGYGLRFQYPANVNSVLDINLDLVKSDESQLISGAIYVRSAEYVEPISIAELVVNLTRNRVPTSGGRGNGILLDIDVETYRSIRINNNLADIVASGSFNIVGTIDHPVILGSLTVNEGDLFFEGNTYEITRGIVSFNNPRETTPYLNVEAETQVREYTVSILLRGSVDKFSTSFRSDPPLSTSSIVSLITAGQTQEEIFGSETSGRTQSGTLAVYGAGTLLSQTLGKEIASQTNRLFGLEKFSIDPFVDSSRDRDPGARVTIGKQLTKNLDVTYITNLGGELQDQTIVIEYRLTDWVTLVGTSQSDSTVAFDVRFRKRF